MKRKLLISFAVVFVSACTEPEPDAAANTEHAAAAETQPPPADAEPAQTVTIPADAAPPLLVVTGVAPDDALNICAEPDANAAIVGMLAPATGISVTAQGTETLDWIHITHDGAEGWVNAQFLSFENAGQTLPIRLTCSGTEPFWGIELSYSRADAHFVFSDTAFTTGFAPPVSPAARTDQFLFAERDDSADFLLIAPEACSDGMSDNVHPYSISARLEGNVLAGCCR
jgi:uncharacterized membrane protein